jgi:predicted RNA binding protein YcfA (HicA-like mRNA interferase family)
MDKHAKILEQILSGKADANIRFDDLCDLLRHFRFEERARGSHHIFRRQDVLERINLQRDGDKAKPYQVRQVRKIIRANNLGGSE